VPQTVLFALMLELQSATLEDATLASQILLPPKPPMSGVRGRPIRNAPLRYHPRQRPYYNPFY